MLTELYTTWTDRLTEFTPTSKLLSTIKNEERKYCCLGVACELSKMGTWSSRGYVINNRSHITVLPHQVKEALNLATDSGMFNMNDLSKSLKKKLNKALTDQNHYDISDYETISLANINDCLENDPTVFTLIQAILKEAPVSLFKREINENQTELSLP